MNRKSPKRALLLAVLTTIFLFWFHAPSQAQTRPTKAKQRSLSEMPAKAYQKVAPVTVKIFCDGGRRIGSGVIIGLTEKNQALILTACHVVSRNFDETDPDIALEFYKDIGIKTIADLKPVRGGVISSFVDRTNDLIVLATGGPVNADKAIRYYRTDNINPGERVAALGYPRSDRLSRTDGRITRIEAKYLVFDAPIAPGNSGGPLIDQHGRMIGMSTFVQGEKEGFAVNVNLVTSVVDNWIKNVRLKERWDEQKYASTAERMYKDWKFIAGETLVVGSVLAVIFMKDDEKFPRPIGRPPTNQ